MDFDLAMKKLLLATAILLASCLAASAQCNGVFPAKTLCGNLGATPAPPSAFSASGTVVGPSTSTTNDLPYWANSTGTLLGDSGIPYPDVNWTTGSAVSGDIVQFTGTGKETSDSGIPISGLLTSGGGVDANVLNSQTSNYTIATTDCGKTIQAGTGSTGQFTITLPSISGFSTICSVLIKNGDTTNAKFLSGFPADVQTKLWPGQSLGVKIVNGIWSSFYKPGRWRTPGNSLALWVNGSTTLNATCGVSGGSTCLPGSASNDGLTISTPYLTLQQAINDIIEYIDFTDLGAPSIYLSRNVGVVNTNYSAVCYYGPIIGTSVANVYGDSTNNLNVNVQDPANSYGLQVKDGCTLQYQYVQWVDSSSNNGAGHILCGGSGNSCHIDIGAVNLGGMTIGTAITVGYAGTITLTGTVTADSGGTWPLVLEMANGGVLDLASQTFGTYSNDNFTTAFAYFENGGVLNNNGSNFTTLTGTGPRCIITGALFASGYDPNQILPGSTACETLTGIGETVTTSLSSDVNIANNSYSNGPVIATGTSGIWEITGTITVASTDSATDSIACRIGDSSSNFYASGVFTIPASGTTMVSLSARAVNPGTNVSIACDNTTSGNTKFKANASGTGKDTTLTAVRLQ